MAVTQDLTKLTDDEVDEKIQKLSQIVFSNNPNLAKQAYPLLMTMYEEQNRRNNQKFEEHLKKSGIKMDDIINIG